MNLALDEVVTNVIRYAHDDGRQHPIVVRLALEQGVLTAQVEDDGRAFNPLDAPVPDIGAGIDDRPIGGLGIHLVRSVMTSVEYRREDGRNVLTMKKRLLGAGCLPVTPFITPNADGRDKDQFDNGPGPVTCRS